jgi:phosphopentomutase
MKTVILLVLDGVGAGELPDAADFGDVGANTLGNLARHQAGLKLPTLQGLGLGNILPLEGVPPVDRPLASFGRMAEKSRGKDSTLGHWELAGLITEQALPVYPQGFPLDLLEAWRQRCELPGWLGNMPASGTDIIRDLGSEHVKSGKPIVYTSADSVFQIAAHEEVISLDRLYHNCEVARELLVGEHAVARVIARPFIGSEGAYERTANRRDFSLEPFGATALDMVGQAGVEVIAIGKIKDLFAGIGIHRHLKSKGNAEGMEMLIELLKEPHEARRLILLNLVDFDMLWGHRLDPVGFKGGLEAFDQRLPDLLNELGSDELLIMTADHGNDPTGNSTDHSREYVPLLVYQKDRPGRDLGTRACFADVATSICEAFGLEGPDTGRSFLEA